MSSSVTKTYKPADLIKFLDIDSEFAGIIECPTVVFNIGFLGKEANGIFGQTNEELYRKNSGWKKRFDEAAEKFEKIAGFRPEAVYQAEVELREAKGLPRLVDRQREPLLEGLNLSPVLRAKEG